MPQDLLEAARMYSLHADSTSARASLHCVTEPPEDTLESIAAASVGGVRVDDAVTCVRRAMLREALIRSAGNLTKAAHLLGVHRQAVQHMVNRYELRAWASALRKA